MAPFSMFGCALDPDERDESVKRKIDYAAFSKENPVKRYLDPYDALSRVIRLIDSRNLFSIEGKIDVESWLTPFPLYSDLQRLSVQSFVSFIDSGGCREYADKVYSFTRDMQPDLPFLVGIDHSTSGGVLRAISEECGEENVTAIFLDSHFDAIPSPVRCEMIHYDIENNLESMFSADDPYIYGRADSYNPESFIKFLIDEKVILPENTFCIGVSNYPSAEAFEIDDPRVKRYIKHFLDAQHRGLTIVEKEDLRRNPNILESIFENRTTNYTYISIDMDVGANNACNGVRFKDYTGLSLEEILHIAQILNEKVLKRTSLKGIDLTEIDMHSADEKTFTVALLIIRELLHLEP